MSFSKWTLGHLILEKSRPLTLAGAPSRLNFTGLWVKMQLPVQTSKRCWQPEVDQALMTIVYLVFLGEEIVPSLLSRASIRTRCQTQQKRSSPNVGEFFAYTIEQVRSKQLLKQHLASSLPLPGDPPEISSRRLRGSDFLVEVKDEKDDTILSSSNGMVFITESFSYVNQRMNQCHQTFVGGTEYASSRGTQIQAYWHCGLKEKQEIRVCFR
jgi:hypothetical protein